MFPKVLYHILLVISASHSLQTALLFPAPSVLQITASLAAPIELPERKLYWDWGLQMNYDMPFNISHFYNAPIWPRKSDERRRRDAAHHEAVRKYNNVDGETKKHPSDFTAGELYHSFENLLISYGFHETCLLRSVCELAHHPFADDKRNILTEIITFILTPSVHEAFAPSEAVYREAYEESERQGFLHFNCAQVYHECQLDLLTLITSVVTNSKRD